MVGAGRLLTLSLQLEQGALLQIRREEVRIERECRLQRLHLALWVAQRTQNDGKIDPVPGIVWSKRDGFLDQRLRLGRIARSQHQNARCGENVRVRGGGGARAGQETQCLLAAALIERLLGRGHQRAQLCEVGHGR